MVQCRLMAAMRGHRTKPALHEPENRRLADQRLTQIRFMVAMRPKKRVQTTHEPQGRAGVPPAPESKPTGGLSSRSRWRARGAGGTPALPWVRFMVPMCAKKASRL